MGSVYVLSAGMGEEVALKESRVQIDSRKGREIDPLRRQEKQKAFS